jgi:hypothetical protein
MRKFEGAYGEDAMFELCPRRVISLRVLSVRSQRAHERGSQAFQLRSQRIPASVHLAVK